jgi:hypothetical protein
MGYVLVLFVACFGCAALLLSLSFLDHRWRDVAVAINVALAVCSNCLSRSGALVNPQDLAPR